MLRFVFSHATKLGRNFREHKAKPNGITSTINTRLSTIHAAMAKVMSAPFSMSGKNKGMMIDVKPLAMRRYTVSDAMLPPSLSTITGAAAAVGQMTQINIPSQVSL